MSRAGVLFLRAIPPKAELISLFLSLMLAQAPPAHALSRQQGQLEQLVTTASRIESSALTHIGSIHAIDEQALQMSAPVHIQEALLRVPGVNLNRGEGMEYLPAIRSPVLTGAGACGGFLMAEDGIPLRAAGFCNINELFDAHTEMAQRIEVLRGPGTALYGSNALHGVVNVITAGPNETEPLLGLEVGPYEYARLKLGTALGKGNSRVAFNLSLSHDDSYRAASGYDQQKLTLRHRYQGSAWQVDSGLSASNLEQETAGYAVGLDAYKDEDLARSNPNPEAYRDAVSMRLWSKLSRRDTDGGQWLITPYLRYTDMDFLMHFVPGAALEENGQTGVGVQTAYNQSLSGNLDLIMGLDAEFSHGYLRETQDQPTEGSAFLQATIPQGKHYDYEVDVSVAAPFVHLEWDFTERWQLNAGLRYEWMQYDYENNMLDGRSRQDGSVCDFGGCRFSRPPSGRDTFENWSPKLGLSFQVTEAQMVYLSLARGYRAPQTTELYRLQRDQQLADLDSEQVDSIEFGWKGNPGALHYELAVYHMDKQNYIFRDSNFFNVSNGETRHKGVELNASYSFAGVWDLGIVASYAEHTYAYDEVLADVNINGNQIDTAPRVFGSARLGWNWNNSSRLELEWQHVGRFYLDPENLHQYPGHDLVNLRASWKLQPTLTVYGRVLNLTDRNYAERADYTSFTQERYFPGRPRSVYLGMEWKWH